MMVGGNKEDYKITIFRAYVICSNIFVFSFVIMNILFYHDRDYERVYDVYRFEILMFIMFGFMANMILKITECRYERESFSQSKTVSKTLFAFKFSIVLSMIYVFLEFDIASLTKMALAIAIFCIVFYIVGHPAKSLKNIMLYICKANTLLGVSVFKIVVWLKASIIIIILGLYVKSSIAVDLDLYLNPEEHVSVDLDSKYYEEITKLGVGYIRFNCDTGRLYMSRSITAYEAGSDFYNKPLYVRRYCYSLLAPVAELRVYDGRAVLLYKPDSAPDNNIPSVELLEEIDRFIERMNQGSIHVGRKLYGIWLTDGAFFAICVFLVFVLELLRLDWTLNYRNHKNSRNIQLRQAWVNHKEIIRRNIVRDRLMKEEEEEKRRKREYIKRNKDNEPSFSSGSRSSYSRGSSNSISSSSKCSTCYGSGKRMYSTPSNKVCYTTCHSCGGSGRS